MDALPDDWPAQVVRAYAVFGVEPTELAGVWSRLRGRAIGHAQRAPGIPRVPLNIDFERLHPRDPLGRWKLKPRAYRSSEGGGGGNGGPGRGGLGDPRGNLRGINVPLGRRGGSGLGPGRGTGGSAPRERPGRRIPPVTKPHELRLSPEALRRLRTADKPGISFREQQGNAESAEKLLPYSRNRPGRVFEDTDGWQIQQPGWSVTDREGQKWTARTPDGEVLGYFDDPVSAERAIEEAKRRRR